MTLERAIVAAKIDKSGINRENIKTVCGKLRDFALIYTAYNRISEEIFGKDFDCRDSNDDLERLASVLCDSKFFRGKSVIIDSF